MGTGTNKGLHRASEVFRRQVSIMKEGDFVEIEFVGKVKDTGEVFDLTDEKLAKEEGVYNQGQQYGPSLVIIGARSIVPGVEEELKKMKTGEEKEFPVAYKDAFGPRNPKLVQIVNINKFYQQKINPVPGAYVNIDNKNCKINSVSGGRVRVDFNHPLAGKDLSYKVKVVRQVTDKKEKVEKLLKYYHLDTGSKFEEDKVTITIKQRNELVEKLIEDSIKKWVPEVNKVIFQEEKKAEKPKESAPKK